MFAAPTPEDKLDILAESARYDVCLVSCAGNAAGGVGRLRDPQAPERRWIFPAHVPGKGKVGILKVLQSNVCTNHCSYCFLAGSRDAARRVSFAPEELARLFMGFVRRRLAHGIFISSGVCGSPNYAMSRMVETAEILRRRYRFSDYIHLKVIPGCSPHLIEAAAAVANRLSVNMEAPTAGHLRRIAPEKRFTEGILAAMRSAAELVGRRQAGERLKANSHTTQFVVGAGDESDLEILQTVDWLYRDYRLFRSYFSAYQPPVDAGPSTSEDGLIGREHLLYQCDFLLRGYGFRLPDLVFTADGSLPRRTDPKSAYVRMHPELYPVDVNHAPEDLLLKVPGIGPVSARRIVEHRAETPFRDVTSLRVTGAVLSRAAPFLEFCGVRDRIGISRYAGDSRQLMLLDAESPAEWRTGATSHAPVSGETAQTEGSQVPGAEPYEYPGQTGKRLYYPHGRASDRVRCR